MFDRILVAVDGSDCSRRAARFGLELARTYGATAELVHVSDGSADEERGEALLAEVAELAADAGVDAATHLAEGRRVASAIVERAEATDADLVVVGREGDAGLTETLLGSVAERVLRTATPPVLVVPDVDRPAAVTAVLAPTDGSDVAERAAPYATDVAERYGATLHVLNAVDVQAEAGAFAAGGVDEEWIERRRERGREHVDRYAERVRETAADVAVTEAVRQGRVHEVVCEYASEQGVDLVALASQDESNLAGHLLGSTADRVLRCSDAPVLVVSD